MIFLDTYSFCRLVPKKKDNWKIKKQKKKMKEWKKSFIHLTLGKGHDIVFRWNDHRCKSKEKWKQFFSIYMTLKNVLCRSSSEISIEAKAKAKKKKKKFENFFSIYLTLKTNSTLPIF